MLPTCQAVGAVPKCPPACRSSPPFHTAMGTDEPLEFDVSTTKNTKRHESKKWVTPDKIRAKHSEQEVAAAASNPEPGFP
ncbi:hypothetical protein [Gimesia sp.]|uniref:hypothetical protein n=1 Tax=Gimesia sp. TaxID=2024833 RepID=UPI003A934503